MASQDRSMQNLSPVEEEDNHDGTPLLDPNDHKELTFANVDVLTRHVQANPQEVLESIGYLRNQLFKILEREKDSRKKQKTYAKANESLAIENAQLAGEIALLKQQLDELPHQRSLSPSEYPEGGLYPRLPKAERTTKLPDPPVLRDATTDIDSWISKMTRKLHGNADHFSTETLKISYVDSRVEGDAWKHLEARLDLKSKKPFTNAEQMFDVLRKAYGDVNKKRTAMNKFRDLRMTKDFSSFWAEFQVLSSQLDHSESTLIDELKFKLTPALSRAMAGGVIRPTDLHEYAEQCQRAWQDLQDIDVRTSSYARHGRTTNANTSTNTRNQATTGQPSNQPTTSSYSRPPASASNQSRTRIRPDETRLSAEDITRLRREERCFRCKEVGDHRPCTRDWKPMSVLPSTVNEVAVETTGRVEAENA